MDYPASTTSGNVKGLSGQPQAVKMKRGTTIKKTRTMTTTKPPARKKS